MFPYPSVSLLLIYLCLSFTYSIMEKGSNWQSCTSYYKDHFKNSLLKNHVQFSILLVVIMEVISVVLSGIGLYLIFTANDLSFAMYGLVAISTTLLVLMTGQRIAQDYSGAMNITVYFILSVIGLYMLETS